MLEYLALAGGVYLSGIAFSLDTPNFRSALVFRIVPGVLGFGLIASGATALDFI